MTDGPEDAEDAPGARFVGFAGASRLAAGSLAEVAAAARRALDQDPDAPILVFDGGSAEVADLDLRGSLAEAVASPAPEAAGPARRGRPKLGVVAREVTLLPRHWEWLAGQRGGASVALRRLVDAARKADAGETAARARTAAAYRFMAAMAGDRPGFEAAARALFAGDRAGLEARIAPWPPDIQAQTLAFLDGPAPSA